MKKVFLSFSILFLSSLAHAHTHAQNCKVSGISAEDSPQSITCHYRDGWSHHMKLSLDCREGKYHYSETANGSPAGEGSITSTYHEEVQKGASPLNFKLENSRTLRITTGVLGLFFRGELISENGSSSGRFRCSVR